MGFTLIDTTVPIELTNGNDGRGFKYFKSSDRRKQLESALRLLGFARDPLEVCVDLVVVRILGKGEHFWDADSVLRGNAKELIDSLVKLGWFHDDGPRWIRHCDGRQDNTERASGPAVRIIATSIEG